MELERLNRNQNGFYTAFVDGIKYKVTGINPKFDQVFPLTDQDKRLFGIPIRSIESTEAYRTRIENSRKINK